MLFDFHLRALEEVHPWVTSPDLYLSWFGFTDGFYRLQIGSDLLFNYSNEFVDHCAKAFPGVYSEPFVDYYVVRLWEDLLEILPDVLEPIPKELADWFTQDESAWFNWERNVLDWLERQPDEDQAIETLDLVMPWQNARCLDAAYLQNSPRIWIWCADLDSINISWDNTGILFEGIPVWSASRGHFSMSRDRFLQEVHTFHDQFMRLMAERVYEVGDRLPSPEIQVDPQRLMDEHLDRETGLYYALRKSPYL
ncbi:MAG: DUF5984 family protein, partial [Oculatellaceae cyanobacterium Prado106]|nr:DUF5984 family protein [Oculatellaceae cyanobacterium Prado106]